MICNTEQEVREVIESEMIGSIETFRYLKDNFSIKPFVEYTNIERDIAYTILVTNISEDVDSDMVNCQIKWFLQKIQCLGNKYQEMKQLLNHKIFRLKVGLGNTKRQNVNSTNNKRSGTIEELELYNEIYNWYQDTKHLLMLSLLDEYMNSDAVHSPRFMNLLERFFRKYFYNQRALNFGNDKCNQKALPEKVNISIT